MAKKAKQEAKSAQAQEKELKKLRKSVEELQEQNEKLAKSFKKLRKGQEESLGEITSLLQSLRDSQLEAQDELSELYDPDVSEVAVFEVEVSEEELEAEELEAEGSGVDESDLVVAPDHPADLSTAGGGNEGDDLPDPTPAAERKAEELGVDLTSVSGSGSEGRITVRDVEDAANGS